MGCFVGCLLGDSVGDNVGAKVGDGVVELLQTCKDNKKCGSVECNGKKWSVGDCAVGSTHYNELTVYSQESTCWCKANSKIWTARPCIGNRNWGGMNGKTCNAESQTLNMDYYLGMCMCKKCVLIDLYPHRYLSG